jgi:hypothetical protein
MSQNFIGNTLPDNNTLELSGGKIQVKDSGITLAKTSGVVPTQVNDTDTGTSIDTSDETTFLTVNKTITSGKTVLVIASGYFNTGDSGIGQNSGATLKLYHDLTLLDTVVIKVDISNSYNYKCPFTLQGIITGLSGSITFAVKIQRDGSRQETAYGKLTILEF